MTLAKIVGEPLTTHKIAEGGEKERLVVEVMEQVGLPRHFLDRYPHELSGGQRQRVAIARAIVLKPKLVVTDEPVSALDVSVQAQILNLMRELQRNLELAYLFISHDLTVVKYMSEKIAVMYLGRIIEEGPSEEVFQHPKHPYTKSLLSSVPIPDPSLKMKRIILKGDVPSPINIPTGCPFHPRCYMAQEICGKEVPHLEKVAPLHHSSCHFSRDV
ncbi:MAG: ATP-binding cassette domain-containing protein [Nitrososphaeria archaeon]|nr:ATP-binding cassette domain-containing protein [Nitrososphaeria archaeon]NIQ32773.1 ATP-binding cassette domain-containing protein [Nitrososphaeria archaeon]